MSTDSLSNRGFRNYHYQEKEKGLLPIKQNSPQTCPQSSFAEQFSTSAFTRNRSENLRSWLYKKYPSASEKKFTSQSNSPFSFEKNSKKNCGRVRWIPPKLSIDNNFLNSLSIVAQTEDYDSHNGCQLMYYGFSKNSEQDAFFSSDGEWIIVPWEGKLEIITEFGSLKIEAHEIAVIPRFCRFWINTLSTSAKGYIAENAGSPMNLPDLGPIGANGLANPDHFLSAVLNNNKIKENKYTIYSKSSRQFFKSEDNFNPFCTLAWKGNSYPYKYDLRQFNTINTVSYDHPDPSIFTVLSSCSSTPGAANLDFVVFPPRWMVAENTFRPPYYHRNIMNELMGLISGQYDAKTGDGFQPGGLSIHNCGYGHGPDLESLKKAQSSELKPFYIKDTMAFMFESKYPWQINISWLNHESRDHNYEKCWSF